MKRAMTGGAHRGPVGLVRQRRTIRFVQILLVGIAAGLLMFAGYSWGQRSQSDAAAPRGGEVDLLDAPPPAPVTQTVVLAALGLGALGAAVLLQGREGPRMPTPARLDDLADRAESAAVERAERVADDAHATTPS